MKQLFGTLIILFSNLFSCYGQQSIGEWKSYLSYHNPTRCEVAGSTLYVLANGGLYAYDKADNSVRTFAKNSPLSDTEISFIGYHPEYKTLIIVYNNSNIDLLTDDEEVYNLADFMLKHNTLEKRVNQICFYREYAYLATSSGILCINLKKIEISNFYALKKEVWACAVQNEEIYAATPEGILRGKLKENLLDMNNWKWVGENSVEFMEKHKDIPFKAEIPEGITPNSPLRNYSYYLNFAGERLLVAGGGHIADRLRRKGTILSMENNRWTSFQEEGISNETGHPYLDINCVVQDPKDENHHFAASAGEGIYEFKNGELVNWYSLHNSPLESAVPNDEARANYVRINGLVYDKQNNLWMMNCEAKQSGIHFMKPNGTWVSLNHAEALKVHNYSNTFIDSRGWLWATSSRTSSGGLLCLNANNTPDEAEDDRCRFISRFTNQDGILLDQMPIYCIAEDKEGDMWIGTGKGPIVLTRPDKVFDTNFYCTQIKINRNDGSNLADYLLNGESIQAIAIDGANRKWIGTVSNGIYLLSADGKETIHHFTEKNSPLLSNSIESIAIHPHSGEVFIGTSKGLVSYQSNATEAVKSFQKEEVYAYPNPVRPDYTGVITITGLMYESNVKIVNIAGQLIHQGTSNGGLFTWDGLDKQGRRVPSGIYMVLAADSEGKEGIVTKIAIIR